MLVNHALAFARHGHAVFPVNWPVERDGHLLCSCGSDSRGRPCTSPAKHPYGKLAPNGLLSATTEADTIRLWFGTAAPEANLGVVTDKLVVIDVDPRHGGAESFRGLEREHEMPPTWRVLTGGGGEHVLFAAPDGVEVANVIAEQMDSPPLGRGIDIRAHGGYIVAPPSRHISGREYAWAVDHHPKGVALAPAPAWLVERLTAKTISAGGTPEDIATPEAWQRLTSGVIREYRDMAAAKVAGHLLRKWVDPYLVAGLLRAWNRTYVEPPLADDELHRVSTASRGAKTSGAICCRGAGMPPHEGSIVRLAQKQQQKRAAAAVGEDALALLFAEQHDGHFVFDHTRGEWFRWDDQVWRRDADEYVLDCTRALIRSHKLGRIRTATAVERAARTDRRLARDHTAWNADPLLLGTPGDVVDLRDGELLAPDAAYMVNLSAGVRPAPQGAPHPLWSQFLQEATCGDAELQRYLKQRAGYWLTGDTSREDFDFFYGPGGNGKGVFLKTIASIMGDYALVAPISQFMVSRHDEHLCELARLAHARLVVASEPEENRSWAIGKIKQLTGNESRIAARHMHQNFFEFLPRFKLVFVGNTKPRIAAVDEALARRLNLVPFQFQPATRDEQLKEKLVIEYPAILRWQIDGWLDLKANGRCRPAVIANATKEYLDDENVIAAWLAERCELGPQQEAALKSLFSDWKTWCETNGEEPETNKRLKRRLEKLPRLRFAHGKQGSVVKGIGLKP